MREKRTRRVSWSGCLKNNSQAEALHIKNGSLIRTRTRMQASRAKQDESPLENTEAWVVQANWCHTSPATPTHVPV